MKMDYIQMIQYYLQNPATRLMLSFSMVVLTGLTDFGLGVVMASLSDNISFRTKKLKSGFATKVGIWVLCLLIIPLFMMLDNLDLNLFGFEIGQNEVGLKTIYLIYIVFCFSEVKSIIGHLTGGDGKEHEGITLLKNVVEKIINAIKSMFESSDK